MLRTVAPTLFGMVVAFQSMGVLAAMYDRAFDKVEKTEKAYAPIGVVVSGSGTGTGFLISQCHVLTNYHVLWGDEQVNSDEQFTFGIGASSAADFAKGVLARPVAFGDYDRTDKTCDDWAVLELAQCVGEQFGYVDLLPLSLEQILKLQEHGIAVRTAGYPRTESLSEISVDSSCNIVGMHVNDSAAFANTCSATKQSSGSPVFSELPSEGKLKVFGIMSGVTSFDGVPDNVHLEGADASDPIFFNKAVPITCIYDNLGKFLPK